VAHNPEPTIIELLELRERLPEPAERRAIRERLGLSRERVARELGVSQETVFQWEAGNATPRKANLPAYVELLERLRDTADISGEG
jgi:DNA-binding transcriptional regulator YiaG